MTSVSTLGLALQHKSMIQNSQREISRLNQEIGSGFYADAAKRLGSKTTEAISSRNMMAQLESYQTSIATMSSRMEIMQESLSRVFDQASQALGFISTFMGGNSQFSPEISTEAMIAIKSITNALNASYDGRFLFSGTMIDTEALQYPDHPSPATGVSPLDAAKAIAAANPVTTPADVQNVLDAFTAAFSSDASVPPEQRFEGTFFKGTPLLDADGNPHHRISGKTDDLNRIEYGVQANDPSLRGLLQGLYMFAAVDVSEMPSDAAAEFTQVAVSLISEGMSALQQDITRLGFQQQEIETAEEHNQARLYLIEKQTALLEAVDPTKASMQLNVFQTQLEAGLSLTVRFARLNLASMLSGL